MAQVGPPGAHALQQLLDNHDFARVCSVCEQHELEVRTFLLHTRHSPWQHDGESSMLFTCHDRLLTG